MVSLREALILAPPAGRVVASHRRTDPRRIIQLERDASHSDFAEIGRAEGSFWDAGAGADGSRRLPRSQPVSSARQRTSPSCHTSVGVSPAARATAADAV
ncbi:hypothetical protein GCM10010394_68000 [Streptomyces crystallinus]|uniref:Uncharacterized protein n=1 Tax=Streptomyces crystallinus TaxID=68191 RepID=A0ABN1H2T7_9ACTN